MAFALQLEDSLRRRDSQAATEFANGDGLGLILSRHLLEVEAQADGFILTSILLLDGTHLRHGAAPTLPEAYCEAINGSQIGPVAGSCGTAAFRAEPVYVTDIASDPLWAAYKDLALPHGLRACWSTPIFDADHKVLGTFAIYHVVPGAPSADEIAAIATITDHVARAITWSRGNQDLFRDHAEPPPPAQPH
jgi:GAF domain-containing protein